MRYLFGPVRSRRLGRSLGIDLVPGRLCTYDCIYCEIGVRKVRTCQRRAYAPVPALLAEVRDFLDREPEGADVLTVTASGEPTLHAGLGECLAGLKEMASLPVCVLTNGSLLHLPEVRADLAAADIVVPSLDAARPDTFLRVNRPAACIGFAAMLDGLVSFRKEFAGEIWLEVLLVAGVNDSEDDIAALKPWIERIDPDRVQLNTVVRPPLERFARPVPAVVLQDIAARLGPRVEIIASPAAREAGARRGVSRDQVLALLGRRPCTVEEIGRALGVDGATLSSLLAGLEAEGLVVARSHEGGVFLQLAARSPGRQGVCVNR